MLVSARTEAAAPADAASEAEALSQSIHQPSSAAEDEQDFSHSQPRSLPAPLEVVAAESLSDTSAEYSDATEVEDEAANKAAEDYRLETDSGSSESPDRDWDLDDSEPLETPAFIRAAQRRAYWQKPSVRFVLYVLALLLTLGLALQIIVFKRDYIAAAQPQSKPYLTQLCAYLACSIEPWRSTKSLLLDESSFSKVRDTQYRVSIGLRNKARVPVATPHILLSLNDQDGQVLVRRVFKPNELGLPAQSLNASAEISGQAVVEIENNELANEIVGYKLLIFYP